MKPPIRIRRVLAAALFLVAAVIGGAGAVTASAAASAASAPFCGITWGSQPKAGGVLSPGALTDVRTGRHDCFDRVVFDFNGPATGYRVAYDDQVLSEGRGEPLQIAGGARLGVELLESTYDVEMGDTFHGGRPSLAGYRTLRDVVYGGSFEGYTTFGVGVRARLPFRVFTLAGPGSSSRIVLDVAHRW
jgi:hypothetical protein